MPKFIEVEMPDGTAWRVPALLVAEDRARYYREVDGDEAAFGEEVREVLADDYLLTDWARNNLNWSEVVAQAVKVDRPIPPADYEAGWVNGRMRVVEG